MKSIAQFARELLIVGGIFISIAPALGEDPTVVAHVFDGTGGGLSNTTYSAISAIGQGIPTGTLQSPSHRGYSGFLNNFIFNPTLDHDSDSIADENDPDDDNDGLEDLTELAGAGQPPVSTSPFLADSDSDGFGDADEIAAGTNPQDPTSLLLLNIYSGPGQLHFDWAARSGMQYRLLSGQTMDELLTTPQIVGVVSTNGGVSPWFEVPIQTSSSSITNQAFFAIELVP